MTNKLILVIGPSGVGKGTMLNILRERHPEIYFPISATTRAIRKGEKDGETYHFMRKKEFEDMIEDGEFLEYAQVHGGEYYGTLKDPILNALEEGMTVVREVDYQGFESIREIIPSNKLKSIFILPPSIEVLVDRIKGRAPISDAELTARLESLKKEIKVAEECDSEIELIDDDIEGSYEIFEKEII